ncbi:MAG: hypothetical protein IPG11_17570 [Flavobacteriales bacterium]|nr:hypothetical protein [Flavobacteriales bacterium]
MLLNQWLISLFGIDPLHPHTIDDKAVLPYQVLSHHLKDIRTEGLGPDGLHVYYLNVVNHVLTLFPKPSSPRTSCCATRRTSYATPRPSTPNARDPLRGSTTSG